MEIDILGSRLTISSMAMEFMYLLTRKDSKDFSKMGSEMDRVVFITLMEEFIKASGLKILSKIKVH